VESIIKRRPEKKRNVERGLRRKKEEKKSA